jgi:hypothetical protein
MPKCNECNNNKEFIVTYMESETQTYEGDDVIDQYAGDRDRLDHVLDNGLYKPECASCGSTDIEGEIG